MKKSIIYIILLLFFRNQPVAGEPAYEIGNIMESSKVLFVSRWNVGVKQSLLCVISEETEGTDDTLPTRVLSFYKKDAGRYMKIFAFETCDSPVSMFQTGEMNGRFFTLWMGGSAFHFYAFAYSDGKIEAVLEGGARTFPEIVINRRGDELIILSDVEWLKEEKNKKTITGTSKIYKWNGKKYGINRDVPWESRFKGLSDK